MPDKQEIEFIIRPDGTVEEQVIGVSGPDCEKITEAIEIALGTVTDRDRKPDFFNNSQDASENVTTGL